MSHQPPGPLRSPDGTVGWYAYPPDGQRPDRANTPGHREPAERDEVPWEGPREGSLVRFMGEEGADVPLWGDDGPLFDDGAELLREWAVSAELVEDIVAWALAWGIESGEPKHDAEAARLVRQLSRQLNYRFLILYHP